MNGDLAGLSLVELYDELVMPNAPAPVSMWPQTAGWIWLAFGVLGVVGVAVWTFIKWRRATAYRRAALAELYAAGDDPVAIAIVLRRTALSGFPRDTVAGLHGAEWLAFLDSSAAKVQFEGSEAGTVLVKAPYTPQVPNKDLPAMAATWIKTHQTQGART